ncbi:MAG: acyl transferase [Elusimicrobia bacterium]|nr:acyl transferase [Elusimicrobiota bacterium]
MTIFSRFFAFFPSLQMIGIGLSLAAWLRDPSLERFGWALAAIYVLPLAAYRALRLVAPVQEGVRYLDRAEFVPWWAAHQTQAVLNAVPQFEAALRLIPGAFSAWLRLWGSRVGAGVYWTAHAEVVDRDLLDIGDRAIIGAKAVFCSHVVNPGSRGLMLYVKRIRVGSRAFLGACARLGPGATIEPGGVVPVSTDVYPNRVVGTEAVHAG